MKKNTIRFVLYYVIGMITLIILILAHNGCGYRQSMRVGCHWDTQICDNLFGKDDYELQSQVDKNSKDIKTIEQEIISIKTSLNNTILDVILLQQQLSTVQSLLNLLQTMNSNQTQLIEQLQSQMESLLDSIEYQQVIINSMQIELNNLAISGDPVVEYIYPCGRRPGYFDEILMRTKSNQYVAYFEQNGSSQRFLTILQRGMTYQTTDSNNNRCTFTLDNYGSITNAHRN